ncbi:M56 family metallopeptidase [Dactylosporangium sp. NPDC049525]|uniref:M56 family metallopeptidase n=1 Tax=Dactylosporangium sp. NPDC049525 TaxID=3154730 RepID=UPI00341E7BF4
MTCLVYLPLVLPLLLVPLTRRLTRSTHPQTAARTLALCAAVTAAAGAGTLALVVLTLFDDLPAMERREAQALSAGVVLPEPVPDLVAAAALLLAGWLGWRIITHTRQRRCVVRDLRAAGPPHNGLLVADWDRPHAVAVPGQGRGVRRRSGHVLVTSGLLRLLDPDERAAVLAHERAHLRLRHHRLIAVAGLAAAVHPLLRPVADGVGLLVERASDEDAALTVGDRRLVARTVAKVALASQPAAAGVTDDPGIGGLGIGGSNLMCRIDALTRPPVPVSGVWSVLACAVMAVTSAAAGGAVRDFIALIQAWSPSA